MTKELFTILTWNLNGYRARIDEVTSSRKLIEKFEADIICLQETKLKEDSSTYHVGGYGDKFNFSKAMGKTNVPYAGTATYWKKCACPKTVDLFEEIEGRCIITVHLLEFHNNTQKEVAIINVYAPFIEKKNLKDREEYRKKFLEDLQKKCIELRKQSICVILVGDLNFVHCELDLADNIQLNQDLYPRKWLSKMLESLECDSALKTKKSLTAGFFIDAFRRKNPAAKKFTAKNDSKTEFTQRLDYILVDVDLFDYVIECDIIDDSRGSDHRPVFLKINCKPIELEMEEETSSQPKITASFKPSTSYAKESCNRKRKNEEENKESKKLKRKR